MARTRMIKPEFWSDEKLASVSRDARLVFIGLWTASDDYGVVKGHPVWLKAQVFPYDEITTTTFQKWMGELEQVGVIIPFNHHNEKYYFIKSFQTHQKISHPSPAKNPNVPESIRNGSGEIPVETESKLNINRNRNRSDPKDHVVDDFETFWKAYPKKVGKLDAQKAWRKNGRPKIEIVLEAIAKQRASPGWLKDGGQYIPNPATWINQGRWDDEVDTIAAQPKTQDTGRYRDAEDLRRKWSSEIAE